MSEGLRKYRKKIIAVLVIILMIVFIIDIGLSRGGSDPSADEVIGYVGDGEEITNAEQRQYAAEWNLLTRGEMAQYTPRFLSDALLSNLAIQGQDFMAQFMAMQVMRSVQALASNIDERTYMLLVEEADRFEIQINRDQLEGMRNILSRLPSQDPETRDRAVINWMNVVEVFNRMSRAVKVSPAQAVHGVAEQQQQVALEVVPFSAADHRAEVPDPTPDQLQAFFEKYRNLDAEANEFGIGYRFPNRVKVEYVKVPKDAIAKTITDEDLYKHWKDNQSQFQRPPDTQPATTMPEGPLGPSATMPATTPATAPVVASAEPTTRPWTEVKDQIRDILAKQRALAMSTSITQTLRSDWPNFREATRTAGTSATQPSNAPTSLGVPYNTYAYLQALQKRVQTQKDSRGVLPELVWDDNFLTARELEQLPGIGKSRIFTQGGPVPFAEYAIRNAEAFMSEAQRRQAQESQLQTLALYQPSPPFYEETTGNYFIFRLTDAEPAHPAESLAVVESRVGDDWKSLQAYELAREAARMFLEQARAQGLEKAADGRKIITTDLFRNDPNTQSLPTYTLSPPATRRLIQGGFDLLAERVKTSEAHPLSVIDLPRALTSVVARLADAAPATKDQFFAVRVQQEQQMREFERIRLMMFKWFDPEAVAARTNFKPAEFAEPVRRATPPPAPVFPGR